MKTKKIILLVVAVAFVVTSAFGVTISAMAEESSQQYIHVVSIAGCSSYGDSTPNCFVVLTFVNTSSAELSDVTSLPSTCDCVFAYGPADGFSHLDGVHSVHVDVVGFPYGNFVFVNDNAYSFEFFPYFFISDTVMSLSSGSSYGGYDEGYEAGYTRGLFVGYENCSMQNHESIYQNGLEAGYSIGHSDGMTLGLQEGESNGYAGGYSIGVSDGMESCAELNHDSIFQDGYNDGYDNGFDDGWTSAMTRNSEREDSLSPYKQEKFLPSYLVVVAGVVSVVFLVSVVAYVVRAIRRRCCK